MFCFLWGECHLFECLQLFFRLSFFRDADVELYGLCTCSVSGVCNLAVAANSSIFGLLNGKIMQIKGCVAKTVSKWKENRNFFGFIIAVANH